MRKLVILLVLLLIMGVVQATVQAQETSQTQATEQAQDTEQAQATVQAQESDQLEVSAAAICKDVVDHEPVDSGISFSVTVEKLYCFTKITGAQSPTQITHVWYFDGTERARVDLAVNSISWRTYSSKIIQPHELGAWRVDVLDAEGNVLKTLEFEVAP